MDYYSLHECNCFWNSVCLTFKGSRRPLGVWTGYRCRNSYWRYITNKEMFRWRTRSHVVRSSGIYEPFHRLLSAYCITYNFPSLHFYYAVWWCTHFFFFQVLINGLQHLVSANVKPKLQMVETFIKVTLIFKLLWTDENKLFVAYFKLDWLLCTVRTVFKVYNVFNLLMMHHQTGVLPPRNWICTLGTCSPGKKLTLNWEKLEIFMTCKTFKSPIRMPLF